MILDCTLRDGGYINEWNFSENAVKRILTALAESGADIIECGFLSQTKGNDSGSTRFQSFAKANQVVSSVPTLKKKNAMCCVMVNLGECNFATIPDYDKSEHSISGIRLAFHKKDWRQALEQAEIVLQKGYRLFVQPMVTAGYPDSELVEMISAFNRQNIFAMYIVDSFGSMSGDEFRRLFYLFAHNVRDDVVLGYHSHNNLQLAYSNAIDFIGLAHQREICIDSSIFGMGRGAGNLNTELLADYLNHRTGAQYSITPLLEVMDDYLEHIYKEQRWGYSIEHFLSATLGCHPNYATHLLSKKNLSIVDINRILAGLDGAERQSYNPQRIEALYHEHKFLDRSKPTAFNHSLEGRNIVILASGPSAEAHADRVKQLIKDKNALLISLNHISETFAADLYFFSNPKRYSDFADKLNPEKLLVTSNLLLQPEHQSATVVSFKELFEKHQTNCDNVAILCLNLLSEKQPASVNLAGLDGYDIKAADNYAYNEPGQILDKTTMLQENQAVRCSLKKLSNTMTIRFTTPSIFRDALPFRICGVIPARYQSSRFEGKPLALIDGIPMIKRTYNQASKCKLLDRLVVATDSEKIFDYCKDSQIDAVMTSDKCLTGTDRIAEVARKLDYDLYINIQGDEPVISPETITQVVEAYQRHGDDFVAYNLYKKITPEIEPPECDTIIKVIVNEKSELVYMSRQAVPFSKSGKQQKFYKQVCVYGFTPLALNLFSGQPKTCNEQFEDIEILRFIDLGYKVKMIETTYDSIAVDVPSDIDKVEDFLRSKN